MLSQTTKKTSFLILKLLLVLVFVCFFIKVIIVYQSHASERAQFAAQNKTIEQLIESRRLNSDTSGSTSPFNDTGVLNVLFIGLDSRIGQENGHCDAIQLLTLDTNQNTILITAVPRGTYSSLPPGTAATSTDYYVSNACGFGGIDYGIKQIEKILGVQADYVAIVGFSETVGILRYLKLPTTETIQWLRNRHGYSIGEPQRARNHSTFIRQMILKFVNKEQSFLDTSLQHIVYKLIKTDLTFDQVQIILDTILSMDLQNNPEHIQLTMRPLYLVQDIEYDPNHIDDNLDQTIEKISQLLSKDDYSNDSKEVFEEKLSTTITTNIHNKEFIVWAYKNSVWLQLDDMNESLDIQYQIVTSYIDTIDDKKERTALIADYIIEMEHRNEPIWQQKGKDLLKQEFGFDT